MVDIDIRTEYGVVLEPDDELDMYHVALLLCQHCSQLLA